MVLLGRARHSQPRPKILQLLVEARPLEEEGQRLVEDQHSVVVLRLVRNKPKNNLNQQRRVSVSRRSPNKPRRSQRLGRQDLVGNLPVPLVSRLLLGNQPLGSRVCLRRLHLLQLRLLAVVDLELLRHRGL